MSLFTITFESTDSDAVPEPVPLNAQHHQIAPPQEPPSLRAQYGINKHHRKRRKVSQDAPCRIITTHVDLNKYSSDSYSSSPPLSPKVALNEEFSPQPKRPRRERVRRVENIDNHDNNESNKENHKRIRRIRNSFPQQQTEEISTEKQQQKQDEDKEIIAQGQVSSSVSSESSDPHEQIAGVSSLDNSDSKPKPITEKLIKYKFKIDKQITLKGKRIHYQLYKGSMPLYHSKVKGRKGVEEVPISKGSECHFSSEHEGVLLVNPDNRTFSLRKETRYGEELCGISFHIDDTEMKPRVCHVHSFGDHIEVPHEIQARSFVKRPDGTWILKVSNRAALSSIKNCILVDENDVEWIVILKMAKSVLSIEASPKFDPLVVFAIGIASYMCK